MKSVLVPNLWIPAGKLKQQRIRFWWRPFAWNKYQFYLLSHCLGSNYMRLQQKGFFSKYLKKKWPFKFKKKMFKKIWLIVLFLLYFIVYVIINELYVINIHVRCLLCHLSTYSISTTILQTKTRSINYIIFFVLFKVNVNKKCVRMEAQIKVITTTETTTSCSTPEN